MPLKKDIIQVPLAGKLDESIDEKLAPAGVMLSATNCIYDKEGRVGKSPGNELVATTIDSAANYIDQHAFFPTANGLAVAGLLRDSTNSDRSLLDEGYQVCTLSSVESKWRKTGRWQPIQQLKKRLSYSDELIWSVDTTTCAGYIYTAAVVLDQSSATPREYSVRLNIFEEGTNLPVLVNHRLTTGKTSPKLVTVNQHVHLYVANAEPWTGPADSSISLYVLDPAAPTTVPSPATVLSDTPASGLLPMFDATYLNDSTYGHCSVMFSSGNTGYGTCLRYVVQNESGSGVRTAVDNTRTPVAHIAVQNCYDYNTTNNYIIVLHGEGTTTRCAIYDDALGVHVANYQVDASRQPEQLAVCEDPADSYSSGAANSAFRIYIQKSIALGGAGTGTTVRYITSERRLFTTGAIVGSVDSQITNWRLSSKPFVQDGKARVWCSFDTGVSDAQPRAGLFSYNKVAAADASCVHDLDCLWGIDTFERSQAPSNSLATLVFSYPPLGNISSGSSGWLWGSYEAVRVESVGAFPITSKTVVLNEVNWSGSNLVTANLDGLRVLPGGRMGCFDGAKTYDLGFAHAPEITGTSVGGAGGLTAGTYSYTAIYEWTDATGKIHRSAPANIVTHVSAGSDTANLGFKAIHAGSYDKLFTSGTVKIAIYRNTIADPTSFHRVDTVDNQDTTQVTYSDGLGDVGLATNPLLYTHGGVLGNATPPPTRVVHQHRDRLFAIDEENPNMIVYTKPLQQTVGPEFAGIAHIMPEDCVALGSLGSDVIVFSANSVYVLRGNGVDVFGSSGYFVEELRLPASGSVSQNAIKNTNIGLVWHDGTTINVMSQGGMSDLGSPVQDILDGKSILRIDESGEEKRIRFLYNGGMVVYDYEHNRWSKWSYYAFVGDMARHSNGDLYFWSTTPSTSPLLRETPSAYVWGAYATAYAMFLETPWLKLGNLTGYQRLYYLQILGSYLDKHDLVVTVYTDYKSTIVETITFDAQATVDPYEVIITPSVGRCQTVKLTIGDSSTSGTRKSCTLSALEIVAGFVGPRARTKNGV